MVRSQVYRCGEVSGLQVWWGLRSTAHQLSQLGGTKVDLPALSSTGHAPLVGHLLERTLLLLYRDTQTRHVRISEIPQQ